MGLPSGVRWAPYNVDARNANGFARSAEQYECSFFSWGNTEPHEPISDSEFGYNWGNSNESVYATTPGAAIEYPGVIGIENDPAHIYCGGNWRMPTQVEFAELIENVEFLDADGNVITSVNKLTVYRGIVGILLRSILNGAVIFLPCSGSGVNNRWDNRGQYGNYWTVDLESATSAYRLSFYSSGGVDPNAVRPRYSGLPIRPVWSE